MQSFATIHFAFKDESNDFRGDLTSFYFFGWTIVTPKNILFYYLKKSFPDQSILKMSCLMLKTEALDLTDVSSQSSHLAKRTSTVRDIEHGCPPCMRVPGSVLLLFIH